MTIKYSVAYLIGPLRAKYGYQMFVIDAKNVFPIFRISANCFENFYFSKVICDLLAHSA